MRDAMKFSVLGVGAAFVDEEMAAAHGFTDCDMNSELLPPRLRRRMSSATRLALAAGERACVDAGVEANSMPSIFASIVGEIKVTDVLCRNIAEKNLPVSPTQFHNSVHNTAAGYWSIVTKNQHASQAISAGENTLLMGLLEAHGQLQMVAHQVAAHQVLLICYEEKAPEPLVMGEQVSDCAVALLLGDAEQGGTTLEVYRDDVQADASQSWSAVEKALNLAALLTQPDAAASSLVSTAAEGWCAKVVKGG